MALFSTFICATAGIALRTLLQRGLFWPPVLMLVKSSRVGHDTSARCVAPMAPKIITGHHSTYSVMKQNVGRSRTCAHPAINDGTISLPQTRTVRTGHKTKNPSNQTGLGNIRDGRRLHRAEPPPSLLAKCSHLARDCAKVLLWCYSREKEFNHVHHLTETF